VPRWLARYIPVPLLFAACRSAAERVGRLENPPVSGSGSAAAPGYRKRCTAGDCFIPTRLQCFGGAPRKTKHC